MFNSIFFPQKAGVLTFMIDLIAAVQHLVFGVYFYLFIFIFLLRF